MKVEILGIPIDNISMQVVRETIEKFILDGKSHKVYYANPHVLLMARKHPELSCQLKNADIVLPDGYGIVLASKILKLPIRRRINGLDFLWELAERASAKGWSFYFLGARRDVLIKSIEILKDRFEGIKIIGSHHGYFSGDEEDFIVSDIREKKPDIAVVCMGVGKQESFIDKYSSNLDVPVFFGNGAALDIISGRFKRAPPWMQKCGLEWTFRFFQEPQRLWKRYMVGNIKFMALILKEWLRR
jgi:N-acetylglucosaminyldiphosphoundecaprenol N-acetyl-beta-D-mannosaminyltransferase